MPTAKAGIPVASEGVVRSRGGLKHEFVAVAVSGGACVRSIRWPVLVRCHRERAPVAMLLL